jgi:hypothetical protein
MNEPTTDSGFHWPDDDQTKAREAALPEHERDRDTSVGAGVVAAAGLSTDTDVKGMKPLSPDAGTPGDLEDEPGSRADEPSLEDPGRLQMGGRSG